MKKVAAFLRVLVANPKTTGIGVTLVFAGVYMFDLSNAEAMGASVASVLGGLGLILSADGTKG